MKNVRIAGLLVVVVVGMSLPAGLLAQAEPAAAVVPGAAGAGNYDAKRVTEADAAAAFDYLAGASAAMTPAEKAAALKDLRTRFIDDQSALAALTIAHVNPMHRSFLALGGTPKDFAVVAAAWVKANAQYKATPQDSAALAAMLQPGEGPQVAEATTTLLGSVTNFAGLSQLLSGVVQGGGDAQDVAALAAAWVKSGEQWKTLNYNDLASLVIWLASPQTAEVRDQVGQHLATSYKASEGGLTYHFAAMGRVASLLSNDARAAARAELFKAILEDKETLAAMDYPGARHLASALAGLGASRDDQARAVEAWVQASDKHLGLALGDKVNLVSDLAPPAVEATRDRLGAAFINDYASQDNKGTYFMFSARVAGLLSEAKRAEVKAALLEQLPTNAALLAGLDGEALRQLQSLLGTLGTTAKQWATVVAAWAEAGKAQWTALPAERISQLVSELNAAPTASGTRDQLAEHVILNYTQDANKKMRFMWAARCAAVLEDARRAPVREALVTAVTADAATLAELDYDGNRHLLSTLANLGATTGQTSAVQAAWVTSAPKQVDATRPDQLVWVISDLTAPEQSELRDQLCERLILGFVTPAEKRDYLYRSSMVAPLVSAEARQPLRDSFLMGLTNEKETLAAMDYDALRHALNILNGLGSNTQDVANLAAAWVAAAPQQWQKMPSGTLGELLTNYLPALSAESEAARTAVALFLIPDYKRQNDKRDHFYRVIVAAGVLPSSQRAVALGKLLPAIADDRETLAMLDFDGLRNLNEALATLRATPAQRGTVVANWVAAAPEQLKKMNLDQVSTVMTWLPGGQAPEARAPLVQHAVQLLNKQLNDANAQGKSPQEIANIEARITALQPPAPAPAPEAAPDAPAAAQPQ